MDGVFGVGDVKKLMGGLMQTGGNIDKTMISFLPARHHGMLRQVQCTELVTPPIIIITCGERWASSAPPTRCCSQRAM